MFFASSLASIDFPKVKNVAFTLYLSNTFNISGVLVVDGPSSKVKYTTFLPSVLTGYCLVPFKVP